jgi:hypothetical protein
MTATQQPFMPNPSRQEEIAISTSPTQWKCNGVGKLLMALSDKHNCRTVCFPGMPDDFQQIFHWPSFHSSNNRHHIKGMAWHVAASAPGEGGGFKRSRNDPTPKTKFGQTPPLLCSSAKWIEAGRKAAGSCVFGCTVHVCAVRCCTMLAAAARSAGLLLS